MNKTMKKKRLQVAATAFSYKHMVTGTIGSMVKNVQCNTDNCTKTFKKFGWFEKHLLKVHL